MLDLQNLSVNLPVKTGAIDDGACFFLNPQREMTK
jgi:hypothetical protein